MIEDTSGADTGRLQAEGTVTAANLRNAIYHAPAGAKEDSPAATDFQLELVYSRSEGLPIAEVMADESKLPTKTKPVPPPPYATANTPTSDEMQVRAAYVAAEEPAYQARTDTVTLPTDRKGFDDAQEMDRHDLVYLKDDPAVTPQLYATVKAYEPSDTGPMFIAALVAGLALIGGALLLGRRKAVAA
jgi:hypothetical protein